MTRITQTMTARLLLADLQTVGNQLAQTQQRIASGKQLTVPSDDPFATGRALQLRSELEEYRQYQRNIADIQAWQATTETAVSQLREYTLRARELVVRGANGALGAIDREAIAKEIDQLAASVKAEANAQYAGRYVLAGSATSTPPYNQTDDFYGGDANGIKREIGQGVQVRVNVDGGSVVGSWDPGTSTGTGLLGALRRIAADLRSGDTAALSGSDLRDLDAAHAAIVGAQAQVGALQNRLDSAQSRLAELEENVTRILSETEDADMAKTLVDYSTQQAVYQAALKAGAQLIQPSLIDFLR